MTNVSWRPGAVSRLSRILIRPEQHRNCFAGMSRSHQLSRWMLDFFLRYGFSIYPTVLFLTGWVMVSAYCFNTAMVDGRSTARHTNVAAEGAPPCTPRR